MTEALPFPTASLLTRDLPEASGPGDAAALGMLPAWDFTGLYAAPEQGLEQDISEATAASTAFAARYEGKLSGLSGDDLAAAITEYEQISEKLGRVMSYVGLRYHQNTADPARAKALGDAQTRITDLTAPLVFFTLELNQVDEESLSAKSADSTALRRYSPWLDRLRAMRPHQLSDELEKFLHDNSVVGASAWNR
ncbi:MAG: oligoendopeptidase F, partial [Rhodobacteraceae bacterium]|nr:oligoendopeptidase F [Paracoccaceae bacterium]